MSDLPGIVFDANPEQNAITGKKALNLAKNILQNLDLTQHNPNDILSALRDNNINVTVPAFYEAFNDITGTKTRANRIKYVNQQYVPRESILEPSLYKLPTNYRIVHRVTYTDLETGLEITREFSLDTDTLSSIGDMQAQVIDAMESRYPIEIISISTIGGYINSK